MLCKSDKPSIIIIYMYELHKCDGRALPPPTRRHAPVLFHSWCPLPVAAPAVLTTVGMSCGFVAKYVDAGTCPLAPSSPAPDPKGSSGQGPAAEPKVKISIAGLLEVAVPAKNKN